MNVLDEALDELPRPAAVWDSRDDAWFRGPFLERAAWLREHGLPALKMYRAEFYIADAPFARIFCYALDHDGGRHWAPGHTQEPHDHSGCDVARERPRDVLLGELPPEELR